MAAPASTVEIMRRSTRVRAELPLRVRSLDPARPFDLQSRTVIVNAHGCGFQSPVNLPIDVPVEVEIDGGIAHGKILNSALIDADRKVYITGLALDKPANFWGLPSPPADWVTLSKTAGSDTGGKIHPFAKKKSAQGSAARVHPFTRPAPARQAPSPPSPPAQQGAASLSDDHAAQVRTQNFAELERWRADTASALAALRDNLQQKLANDAESWRAETHRATETVSELLRRSDEQARSAAQQVTRIESAAASAQSEIGAALAALQRSAASAQSNEAELARLRGDIQRWTETAPALVEQLVRERAGQAMDSVALQDQEKLSGIFAPALQDLRRQIGEMASATTAEARTRVFSEFDARRQDFLGIAAARIAEIDDRERSFRESSSRFADELARRTAEAMAAIQEKTEQTSAASLALAVSRIQESLDSALQRLHSPLEVGDAEPLSGIAAESLTVAEENRALLREEAEQTTEAAKQRMEAIAGAAASEVRARLIADLDSRQSALFQSSDELSAKLSRQAEEAMAGLRLHIEQASAASLARLTEGFEAAQQKLDAHVQEQSWEYDAQAEAAAARLQDKLGAALQQLETDIERRQAQLAAESAEATRKLAEENLSSLRAESERQAQAFRERIEQEVASRNEEFAARQRQLDATASALQAQHEAVSKDLQELQQTRGYIESVLAALPETLRAHTERHASEAWERLRGHSEQHISETLRAETERGAARLHDEIDAASRKLREEMALQGEHTATELQSRISATLSERQREIANELEAQAELLQARTASAAADAQARVQNTAEESARSAKAVASEAADAASRLKALQAGAEAGSDALKTQIEQAQIWLQSQTAEFQKTVHDAFLSAGGEIRGRVHSAVDTAEELIRQKSKDAMSQLDAAAKQHAQAVSREADEAQARISTVRASATDSAEKALQARLVETLDVFRNDASRLAQSALSRWQLAMDETLRAIPSLLQTKLEGRADSHQENASPAAKD